MWGDLLWKSVCIDIMIFERLVVSDKNKREQQTNKNKNTQNNNKNLFKKKQNKKTATTNKQTKQNKQP